MGTALQELFEVVSSHASKIADLSRENEQQIIFMQRWNAFLHAGADALVPSARPLDENLGSATAGIDRDQTVSMDD